MRGSVRFDQPLKFYDIELIERLIKGTASTSSRSRSTSPAGDTGSMEPFGMVPRSLLTSLFFALGKYSPASLTDPEFGNHKS